MTIPTDQIKNLVKKASPKMDGDTLDYVLGYFDDDSNDLTEEGLQDFLQPLLSASSVSDSEIDVLCARISQIVKPPSSISSGETSNNESAKRLDSSVNLLEPAYNQDLLDLNAPGKIGDIRHIMSKTGPSMTTVDQKKLRKAELKLASKRAERVGKKDDLYESANGIPIWNPNVKPSMIINQMKPSNASQESRSKDIRLENFDISFAGKKILTNANVHMSYGRRYGLVGKNGIGKSTLLRAIAHGELYVPPHIKILHVEQEVS
jgi:ATP-binding cassette subfamily F protein 3